ncbi:hypothetical protein DYB37_001947 [Aphanomyces astaci]|uniref:Uncharacterized protein n=1 Tax=Aphanomyces astaci TaxID=112090 RepID=A0A3R6XV21_APHAT|nr:hypothetical protein DYB37_001947 [Aphanomyces astaci]
MLNPCRFDMTSTPSVMRSIASSFRDSLVPPMFSSSLVGGVAASLQKAQSPLRKSNVFASYQDQRSTDTALRDIVERQLLRRSGANIKAIPTKVVAAAATVLPLSPSQRDFVERQKLRLSQKIRDVNNCVVVNVLQTHIALSFQRKHVVQTTFGRWRNVWSASVLRKRTLHRLLRHVTSAATRKALVTWHVWRLEREVLAAFTKAQDEQTKHKLLVQAMTAQSQAEATAWSDQAKESSEHVQREAALKARIAALTTQLHEWTSKSKADAAVQTEAGAAASAARTAMLSHTLLKTVVGEVKEKNLRAVIDSLETELQATAEREAKMEASFADDKKTAIDTESTLRKQIHDLEMSMADAKRRDDVKKSVESTATQDQTMGLMEDMSKREATLQTKIDALERDVHEREAAQLKMVLAHDVAVSQREQLEVHKKMLELAEMKLLAATAQLHDKDVLERRRIEAEYDLHLLRVGGELELLTIHCEKDPKGAQFRAASNLVGYVQEERLAQYKDLSDLHAELLHLRQLAFQISSPATSLVGLTDLPPLTPNSQFLYDMLLQLAAFDVRLAAAEIAAASSTQHLQPNDTASASVPVTATPLPAVASTASLASSASKASVGGSNNNNNADGKQQLGGAASSKGSLLPHSKSDASVADSSKGSSSSPSDADDNDSPHVYLRCTLPDRHSDIDACSLDWCAELHDIVVATESTTTPSIDRAFVCKMVHNLRLTKLAINHIDAAFARDCMHLERLDICDNMLRSLDHLPPSLLEVDAYRNQLQTVHLSSSSPTPHLVHVGLGLNMLTSLPTLSHPHTLLSLDLSYNHVTDFAHVLSGLNVFSGLRHVFFTGNPVVLCRGYRHALLASHPNLYVLDDITVSDKEKDVLLQSPAILADNGADLTVYVTAVGFPLRKPQADATAPSITYEATVDVLPGQWSVTMKEDGSMKQPDQPSAAAMPAPGGALNFEATRVPLPVSLALRDIVKCDSDPHHVKDDDDDDNAASTDKQLRERNMALRDALLEKNRRIQFLETKCGDLFVHRHAIDARLQAVLNQWTILLKTLHTLLPSTPRLLPLRLHVAYSNRSNVLDASSKDIVNDIKTSLGFVAPPTSSTSLPPGIQCEIDAWFLTGTEPAAPPSSPDNDAIYGVLTSELDLVTSWVHTLLDNTIAPDDLTKAAIDAKLAAERQVLAYQDKLQTYKLQVHELKSDLNKKELERHSACRRLDRAATHDKMTISSSKKAMDNESNEVLNQ